MLTVKEIEEMYGYCAKTKRLLDSPNSKQANKSPVTKKEQSFKAASRDIVIEKLEGGCLVYHLSDSLHRKSRERGGKSQQRGCDQPLG